MFFKRELPLLFAIFLLGLFLPPLYYKITSAPFLTFSDGAKFAEIARNLILNREYGSNFIFFDPSLILTKTGLFSATHVPPLMPGAIAVSFLLLGISDFNVILTSVVFFAGSGVMAYLLGKHLFGGKVGILAALAIIFNMSLLNYATTGASESLFIFEILLIAYLFVLRKKWSNVCGFLVLILMYFTRAQSIIYIFGYLLFFLLLNFSLIRAVKYFLAIFVIGSLFFLFVSEQGIFAITHHFPGQASSATIRGSFEGFGIVIILKKAFYNLYNLYKLLPQIASPYMWALFFVGLFHWGKDNRQNAFKVTTIFMVTLTFLVTALTIPLYRYIHPVVPFVYLFAIATLVWVIEQMLKYNWVIEIRKWKLQISKEKAQGMVSTLLILIFVVGQTLGVIVLDSRFEIKRVNKDKPPVYVALSHTLKENTKSTDLVITNLDTWGSWYGERKTVWYPLKPAQLGDLENRVDAIYLTSYLIDDENYYMGEEWRQIFKEPNNIKDEFVAENFRFVREYSFSSEDTYEKQAARAVLLVRK